MLALREKETIRRELDAALANVDALLTPTSGGLPISLQIVCRGHCEASALRIGWAYEQATQLHRAKPKDPA